MIVKTPEGYVVMSEHKTKGKRRRLSRPYHSLAAAKKRLREIEFFKNRG